MPQSHWFDPQSARHVWVLRADRVADWPEKTTWTCARFGLLFVADRALNVEPLAKRAIEQGLTLACAWGPGCSLVEDGFDDVIVERFPNETSDDVVFTSSHGDESLAEAIDFFLDAAVPSSARASGCDAWVIFACGPGNARRVKRALEARGATPVK